VRLLSADLLRVLIRDRRLSHRRLADAAGCSPGFVSHLTAGRRASCSDQLAEAIAEVLAVPTTVLFVPEVSSTARQNGAGSAA